MITPDRAGVRVFMVVFTLTVQAVLHAAASQSALAILPMAVLFLSARSPARRASTRFGRGRRSAS